MKEDHPIRDRRRGCPWKRKCDDCNLYIPLHRTEMDGSITAVWNCTIIQLLQMQNDTKDRVLGVQQATESFRNEMAKAQQQVIAFAVGENAAVETKGRSAPLLETDEGYSVNGS